MFFKFLQGALGVFSAYILACLLSAALIIGGFMFIMYLLLG